MLSSCQTILLPCTENVAPADMVAARNIIQGAIPPGYALEDLNPMVTTGRNPHRWVGEFSRADNRYETGCAFMTLLKKDFKRYCPQGSDIRVVFVRPTPNNERIIVEFLVNCYCTKIVRRRRSHWDPNHSSFTKEFERLKLKCSSPTYQDGYTTEPSSCPGT